MDSLREQLLILITTPIYLLVIGLEIGLSHFHQLGAYTRRNTLDNLFLMLANSGIDLLFRGVYVVVLSWFFDHHWVSIHPPFWYWFGLVVGMDFMYYWLHRVD
ncbi:MAG: sterol desaturase family protein, partial [Saprospiraceae bacterium]